MLETAETVIYLGCNTSGSACGDRSLFSHLRERRILAHVPSRRNTLTIYGSPGPLRPLTGEEWGALGGRVVSFEEAETQAARVSLNTTLHEIPTSGMLSSDNFTK